MALLKNGVINQNAWQLNTGTTSVQVSSRIANTQIISRKVANTKKIIEYLHYFIHTYCLSEIQIQLEREKKLTYQNRT